MRDNTPLVVAGDFNVFYAEQASHLTTVLTGNIFSEGLYGADEKPDWDGSNLTDIRPSHNNEGAIFYTWRSEITPLDPGILDRIVYSDSVMKVSNAFVLDTSALSTALLEQYGLQAGDVALNLNTGQYHHYALVADFELNE